MKFVQTQDLPPSRVSHGTEVLKRVLVGRQDGVPNLTQFATALLKPGQQASKHVHVDMHEVFFVKEGMGRMTVDEKVFSIQKDSCVVVYPGEYHEIVNPEDHEDDLVLLYFGIAPTSE